MKTKLFSLIIFFILSFNSFAQQNSPWSNWLWLIGEWKGEGSGQPGQGDGTFSFKTDLDGKILVHKSHSDYPASGNRPAVVHDDLILDDQTVNTKFEMSQDGEKFMTYIEGKSTKIK